MLFNHTNYKYLNIDDFIKKIDDEEGSKKTRVIDGYSASLGESFLYGEYEYSGGNSVEFPGELFKSWVEEKYGSSGYSGRVDADGYVSLTPDVDTYECYHRIYRRDLVSIEDELKRYAEYCYIYISAISNTVDQTFENAKASGEQVDEIIYRFKEVIDKVNWEQTRKDVSYVISIKKILCNMYEEYYKKPFVFHYYGKNVNYPFISKVLAPSEEQYLNKKDIRKREKIHFAYLEKAALKADSFSLGKNPHKSAMHVLSIVFLSFWGLMTLIGALSGLVSALKNKDQPLYQSFGVALYFGLMAIPFLIVGLVFIVNVGKKYKQYKKFNKQYEKYIK